MCLKKRLKERNSKTGTSSKILTENGDSVDGIRGMAAC